MFGGYGMPNEVPNQEVGLDELVDYKPVPARRVVRVTTRYQRQGRGRPLPYGDAARIGPRWRLLSPFLEHFSQAFARFLIRVGLPWIIPEFR
jgi:hypothetical protein